MKQLQLTPPLLIITMGYPGSGKTFFARQFAEQYGLARVCEDVIRYELFEKPLYNSDESEIIGRIFRYMLSELLSTNQTVICDGLLLTKSERNEISKDAKSRGYRSLTVWLQTDIQTSAFRAARRDRRNPDDKYSANLDQQTFTRIKNTLDRPDEKEQSIVISGKHAYRSQSLSVLKKIAGMYAEQMNVEAPLTGIPERKLAKQRTNQLIQ